MQFPSVEKNGRANGKPKGKSASYPFGEPPSRPSDKQINYTKDNSDGSVDGVDLKRLTQAMRRSRRVLEYFREERRRATIQYVGRHWSSAGSNRIIPVNVIAKYVRIVSRSLVSKNPRVMLSTMRAEMKPAVDAMQSWVNKKFVDDYFHETLQRFVIDAMFCVGIMKVAIASPLDTPHQGYNESIGEPFAEVVDLDDFVCDIAATSWKDARFVGHRFRVSYDEAKAMGYFDASERAKLSPDNTTPYNEEGDERIGTLGRGYETDGSEDYREMVTLWEIYLPQEKKIVTLAGDSTGVPAEGSRPLRVQDWFGPKCGPYHFLGFGVVPGNLMPKAPIMDLVDLATLINRLYRKTGDQAERQKTNLLASGTQVDDAGRIRGASDGDIVPCDDPNVAKEMSFGGPHPGVVQYLVHISDVYNSLAGNLDLMSGAGPQSKTATQDTMLNANAAAGVADMQETVVAAVARIVASLLELWWYHPTEVMATTKSLPGLPDMEIRRELHPAFSGRPLSRRGSFRELEVRIDPYSMQYRSPQQRMQFLMGLVKEHLPIFPLLQQSGVFFDWQEYFKLIGAYADEPDVARLFTVQEPMSTSGGNSGGGGELPMQSGSGQREYIRRSIGQDTQANRGADTANAFAKMQSEMESGGE